MNQKREKLTEQFHPITATEARQWFKDGLLTVVGYLWAIRQIKCKPTVNFVIPNVTIFCEEWGISKAGFYRGVKQLEAKGYMKWEATHGLIFTPTKKVISFDENKSVSDLRHHSQIRDSESQIRDSESQIRDSDIYIDRACISDNSDIQTTTDKEDAAVVEEICSNPNSPICQPTQEEIEQAHQEIARISPEIEINSQVKKLVLEFWANLPAAVVHTKKAVREGWKCDNLTGVFVKALKTPPEGAESAANETKKELPKPTKEQRAELQKLGKPAAVEMPDGLIAEAVDFGGSRVLSWWRALNIPFEQLQQP